jgi:hypothetical protein
MQMKLLGITDVDFDIIGQIFYICHILVKKWAYNGTVSSYISCLYIDFKKAYDSVRKEALYNILIEFGIPRKLVGLIKNVFK